MLFSFDTPVEIFPLHLLFMLNSPQVLIESLQGCIHGFDHVVSLVAIGPACFRSFIVLAWRQS
jgi:hypothetical protein